MKIPTSKPRKERNRSRRAIKVDGGTTVFFIPETSPLSFLPGGHLIPNQRFIWSAVQLPRYVCHVIKNVVYCGHFPESTTLPRIQKHFPESKNNSQNSNRVPKTKNTAKNPKYFPESKTFFDSGSCFGFWEVFLNSGMCFGFGEVFLDSGKCFGFWEEFLNFWDVFCPYQRR